MIYGLEQAHSHEEIPNETVKSEFVFTAPEGYCLITEEIAQIIVAQKARGWMPVVRHFCTELRGPNPSEMVCAHCGRVWRVALSSNPTQ